MSELLPCPFCGGEAKQSGERFENTILSWVYCTSCGAAGGYRHTEAEAIEEWNKRADDYKQAAEYWQRMYEQSFTERTCRNTDDDCDAWFKCSECGLHSKLEIMSGGYDIPNFCPNCGAKVVS